MRGPVPAILLSSMLLVTVRALHAATPPPHFWSQRFGSTSADLPTAVAADGSGDIVITGRFQGTVDFGGGNLVSAGGYDIFLARYNADGIHLWSKRFGSTSTDIGNAVAIDASGNVLVTGVFVGTVDFGGGNLVGAGSNDVFLAKYDANGVHQWSKRFGIVSTESGNDVDVDASGNVIVIGTFQGTVDFGGGGLTSAGLNDIFVAKYDAAGTHQWSQRYGSTGDDLGDAVAADASGSPFVTGRFQGTVDFGGGGLVSAGGFDIALAKYNGSGVHQWSRRFGGTSSDVFNDLATDGAGNVVGTGSFSGTADFGGGNLVSAGGNDIVLAKYNASGVHQWSKRFGNTSSDIGQGVALDASGNVTVTGDFHDTVNFGGGGLVSAGLRDIFLAQYDAAGIHTWSRSFGSTTMDVADGIGLDGFGNVVLVGDFEGTVDFGGGGLVSAGSADIVLAKYHVAESTIQSIVDVGNDQGRRVRIQFARSGFDIPSATTPVVSYEAYRRNDAVNAAAAGATSSRRELLDLGWVFAGEIPAHGASVYVMDAPTDADSTISEGMHYSVFFLRGATATPTLFFDSAPDSGYSLDNLAPGAPLNLAYNAGTLNWVESTAADFDYFTVYGSNTNSFGASTVVDYTVSPSLDVNASPYTYYFVTATDFSGNEGKPAVVNTLSGVGGTPSRYALSVAAYPNPFNPGTTVKYTVPSRGHVTVAIYDAAGAAIVTLVDASRPAGAYSVGWDGRESGGGTVSSGVYFVRVGHSGQVRSYKVVLVK